MFRRVAVRPGKQRLISRHVNVRKQVQAYSTAKAKPDPRAIEALARQLNNAPPDFTPFQPNDFPQPLVDDEEEVMDRTQKVINPSSFGEFDIMGSSASQVMVTGYNENCFEIQNTCVYGSVFVYSGGFLCWRAKHVTDITIESLSIVLLVSPSISMFDFRIH